MASHGNIVDVARDFQGTLDNNSYQNIQNIAHKIIEHIDTISKSSRDRLSLVKAGPFEDKKIREKFKEGQGSVLQAFIYFMAFSLQDYANTLSANDQTLKKDINAIIAIAQQIFSLLSKDISAILNSTVEANTLVANIVDDSPEKSYFFSKIEILVTQLTDKSRDLATPQAEKLLLSLYFSLKALTVLSEAKMSGFIAKRALSSLGVTDNIKVVKEKVEEVLSGIDAAYPKIIDAIKQADDLAQKEDISDKDARDLMDELNQKSNSLQEMQREAETALAYIESEKKREEQQLAIIRKMKRVMPEIMSSNDLRIKARIFFLSYSSKNEFQEMVEYFFADNSDEINAYVSTYNSYHARFYHVVSKLSHYITGVALSDMTELNSLFKSIKELIDQEKDIAGRYAESADMKSKCEEKIRKCDQWMREVAEMRLYIRSITKQNEKLENAISKLDSSIPEDRAAIIHLCAAKLEVVSGLEYKMKAMDVLQDESGLSQKLESYIQKVKNHIMTTSNSVPKEPIFRRSLSIKSSFSDSHNGAHFKPGAAMRPSAKSAPSMVSIVPGQSG